MLHADVLCCTGLEGEVRVLTDQGELCSSYQAACSDVSALFFSSCIHTSTEAAGTISSRDASRLSGLREELSAIQKAKKEHASAHPAESSRAGETLVDLGGTKKKSKDPKRSVYYDAVFNPHGTPREFFPIALDMADFVS